MLASLKSIGKVFNRPQALQVALILLTLLIAALTGGAPHDFGGGG
ncbi:MAG: hypothetical protein ACP5R2_02385 [Anaerolineae bacterium]